MFSSDSTDIRKFLVSIKNAISAIRFVKFNLGNSVSLSQLLTNFKPIKQRYQLLLFVVAWLICNEVLSRVLFYNLENDIYPMESDSIGIPMMENLFLGFIVGFFCVLGVVIPKTKILGFVSIVFIGLGTLMTLQGVAYWMIPNHYIASIGHLVPFSVCSYMLLSAWAKRKQALRSQDTANEQAS
jgi:hypothetical protein